MKQNNINFHPSFPFRVTWDITHKCNLRCNHCFVIYQRSIVLDEDAIVQKKIATEIANISPFVVSVAGGEPAQLPHLLDVLNILSSGGSHLVLATNGVDVSSEIIEGLKKIPKLTLQVSLDGAKEEINDNIRGRGTFSKTLRFIEIISKDIPSTVAFTLTSNNYNDVSSMIELCENHNIRALKIQRFIKTDSIPAPLLKPTTSDEHYAAEQIARYFMQSKGKLIIMHPFQELTKMNLQTNQIMKNDCQMVIGKTECTILPNGDVVGCGAHIDYTRTIGNLCENTFLSVWKSICGSFLESEIPRGCKCN